MIRVGSSEAAPLRRVLRLPSVCLFCAPHGPGFGCLAVGLVPWALHIAIGNCVLFASGLGPPNSHGMRILWRWSYKRWVLNLGGFTFLVARAGYCH